MGFFKFWLVCIVELDKLEFEVVVWISKSSDDGD